MIQGVRAVCRYVRKFPFPFRLFQVRKFTFPSRFRAMSLMSEWLEGYRNGQVTLHTVSMCVL